MKFCLFLPVAVGSLGPLVDVPNGDPDGADSLGGDHVARLVLNLKVVTPFSKPYHVSWVFRIRNFLSKFFGEGCYVGVFGQ